MIWPILEARAETQKYFRSFFGSNEDLHKSFWIYLTFKGDNFLYRSTYLPGHGSADNEFSCFMQCLAFGDCRYYTWFSSISECQFFSSCDMLIPDDQGTVTGYIDLDTAKNWHEVIKNNRPMPHDLYFGKK